MDWDLNNIEELMKDIEHAPCRAEIVALGMSFGNMEGCVSQVKHQNDLANMCEDSIYEFIDIAGEVLKKEKCLKPLNEFVNMKVIKIDMMPVFKVFTDAYDCSQGKVAEAKTECQKQAIPELSEILNDFVNEIFEGVSADFLQTIEEFGDSFAALWQCGRDAPSLESTISADDFSIFSDRSSKMLDSLNKWRGDPTKNTFLDANQMWVLQRIMEAVDEKGPMTKGILYKIKPSDVSDLHQCKGQYVATVAALDKVLSDDANMMQLTSVVFDRLLFLNPLRPFVQAFVDTAPTLTMQLLPDVQCLFEWDTNKMPSLYTCMSTIGDAAQAYTAELAAAKERADASERLHGWDDTIGGPTGEAADNASTLKVTTGTTDKAVKPTAASDKTASVTSKQGTKTGTVTQASTGVDAVGALGGDKDDATSNASVGVVATDPPAAAEPTKHSHVFRHFLYVVAFACLGVVGALAMRVQMRKSAMYTAIPANESDHDMFDVESRGLLNDMGSDDDDSSEDDEPIAL
ncbi:hypothetical protein SARC_03160 [Sphaeroforma arctica JP610]|uniref:Uncharacterized protein n=1 Tax=Sphaeroforma arctica JP610 TaxID=667725 RepID=A0A0L0G6J1_9EUKA|nr:hypothetical protein SARC_03160 [Sphaeroforma arctica JP610]KNC84630.1 hypothetical protein SARC_03160 [Sphaeroforma arctica JP610]|eukprot:XP_014158532.1 hypothetical protein SARC_03160 [Sphaeroforma arctica JP610]